VVDHTPPVDKVTEQTEEDLLKTNPAYYSKDHQETILAAEEVSRTVKAAQKKVALSTKDSALKKEEEK
jgi:hypothetical protein